MLASAKRTHTRKTADRLRGRQLSEARVGESAYWAIAIPVMIAAGEVAGFGLRTGLSKM
jgi:hypothetical protein